MTLLYPPLYMWFNAGTVDLRDGFGNMVASFAYVDEDCIEKAKQVMREYKVGRLQRVAE